MAALTKAPGVQAAKDTAKGTAEAAASAISVVLVSGGTFRSSRIPGLTAVRGVPVEVPAEQAEYLIATGLFERCTAR